MTTTREHYLLVKAIYGPHGRRNLRVDPNDACQIMNGRTIWDVEIDDFIYPDDALETEHDAAYEALERRLADRRTILDIVRALQDSVDNDDVTDTEALDEVFEILRDAGHLSDDGDQA